MSYLDWDYLGNCQYPVPNAGVLVLGPEPEVDCGEPAVAVARWYETDDLDEEPSTTLLCEEHLRHVLEMEKEQRESEEGAPAPSQKRRTQMKTTLAEVLEEELTAIQDLLEEGDQLVIERMGIRLERIRPLVDPVWPLVDPVWGGVARLTETAALGAQAIAAILGERHAAKN